MIAPDTRHALVGVTTIPLPLRLTFLAAALTVWAFGGPDVVRWWWGLKPEELT